MNPNSSSTSEVLLYPDLPNGAQNSPEWQAAQALNEHAQMAQGRIALGCCMFWLSDGGYLITALPPMGDVRGRDSWMMIYTAEHLIRIEGKNLHLLAWEMKSQRIDDLRVTPSTDEEESSEKWEITSITAQERDDE